MKRLIGFIGLAFSMFLPVWSFAQSVKLDPMLTMMTQKGADLSPARNRGILKSAPGKGEPLVSVLVRFQTDLAGVEALGGKIRSVIGDIATIDIPLGAINPISKLPNIVYIEAAKKIRARLDRSVPETGVPTIRGGAAPNWTGATGKGVIIGLVDSGIDLRHADFKDPSGKSRILFLWDQSETQGAPPSGFVYGAECTQAIITAGNCSEVDRVGHGTHVAGIAAGGGAGTGNKEAQYRYVGMAPEADLIVVNSLSGEVIPTNDPIVDGIAYIQAKAALLGKPSVINLSFGSDLGPHDGTSNFERALDNASGTGRVIVAAAGNENGAAIHASGSVSQGPQTVEFTLPFGDVEEQLDIWYAGSDQIGIKLTHGTCETPVVAPGQTMRFDTSCGSVQVVSSNENPNNGDREILVILQHGTQALATGAWSATLSSIASGGGAGRFDGWFEFNGDPTQNVHFTNHIEDRMTLVDTSTAAKAIAVGAYNTKNSWTTQRGSQSDSRIVVGDIAAFSSLGPRRSCTKSASCPPIQKPDLTAPGMRIMSTLSANMVPPPFLSDIDPDGVHILDQGTSMSAPHVTGAVALLLQAAPTLTSDQIKKALTSKARGDGFTGVVPNDKWGYGKLTVSAALSSISDLTPPLSSGGGGNAPPSSSSGGGGGGCVMNLHGEGDFTWMALFLVMVVWALWQRRIRWALWAGSF